MVVLLQLLGSITQSGIFPSNILGVQVTEILSMLGPMIFPAGATGKNVKLNELCFNSIFIVIDTLNLIIYHSLPPKMHV